jgi:hypothetical protein
MLVLLRGGQLNGEKVDTIKDESVLHYYPLDSLTHLGEHEACGHNRYRFGFVARLVRCHSCELG